MRRAFRAASVVVTLAAILITAAELLLQFRSTALQRPRADDTPLRRLELAYHIFSMQHPHPHYMFFFPLDPRERLALANEVGSLDAHGFREPGPGHADGRPLAFILGGSAVFGEFASSNAQTITSHLNRLQDEYFFVNAGVPSWNSTQELMRLALDIVERKPALIVAFDGANDAVLTGQIRQRSGAPYPAGTPEFFEIIDGVLNEEPETLRERIHPRRLLPELTLRWHKLVDRDDGAADDDEDRMPESFIDAAAQRYRANHARMAELSNAAGARFVAVFQPVANLHARIDEARIERRPLLERFHRKATAAGDGPGDIVDFSNLFDAFVPRVAFAGPQLDDAAVFVDSVHLTDRGNAIVAEQLWKAIESKAP